jgi:hypothetical protein
MRLWHILLFFAALVASIAAFAPMQAFAPQKPGAFTYDSVSGSIWRAKFSGVKLGPYQAGHADWRLSAFDLAQGRLDGRAAFAGGAIEGEGRVLANRRGDRRITAARLTLKGLPLGHMMLPGEATVTGLDLTFQKGQCTRADGKFSADVLVMNRALLGGFGPPLQGQARCVGDAAEIPLDGQQGNTRVSILITLRANGDARWRASVDGATREAGLALAAAGFRPTESGTLIVAGDMTWLPF